MSEWFCFGLCLENQQSWRSPKWSSACLHSNFEVGVVEVNLVLETCTQVNNVIRVCNYSVFLYDWSMDHSSYRYICHELFPHSFLIPHSSSKEEFILDEWTLLLTFIETYFSTGLSLASNTHNSAVEVTRASAARPPRHFIFTDIYYSLKGR